MGLHFPLIPLASCPASCLARPARTPPDPPGHDSRSSEASTSPAIPHQPPTSLPPLPGTVGLRRAATTRDARLSQRPGSPRLNCPAREDRPSLVSSRNSSRLTARYNDSGSVGSDAAPHRQLLSQPIFSQDFTIALDVPARPTAADFRLTRARVRHAAAPKKNKFNIARPPPFDSSDILGAVPPPEPANKPPVGT